MKLYNFTFTTTTEYQTFLDSKNININSKIFIQIFAQDTDKEQLETKINQIKSITPNATMLATSTAGAIATGEIIENGTVLGISVFEKSDVTTGYFDDEDYKNIAKKVVETLVTCRTKLLIIFAESYTSKVTEMFEELYRLAPHVMVTGGKAGDQLFFVKTIVGNENGVYSSGIVCAAIDSDELVVHNDNSFSYQPLGEEMTITKCVGGVVYEIDNKKTIDVYRYYLGDEIADELPGAAIDFPLSYIVDDELMAVAPLRVTPEGGLVFDDVIKQGQKVRFSYGEIDAIHQERDWLVASIPSYTEAIYQYSCIGRLTNLGRDDMQKEVEAFSSISPMCGFITYGEFYTLKSKFTTTNLTSILVILSENKNKRLEGIRKFGNIAKNKQSRVLKGLTKLVSVTSMKLENAVSISSQYKDLIEKSTIFAKLDIYGNLKFVNNEFCNLVGYESSELIGKSYATLLDVEDVEGFRAKVKDAVLRNICWTQHVVGRRKDGSRFFVQIMIKPLCDLNGKIIEVFISAINKTDDELHKIQLETDITNLKKITRESRYMHDQYKVAIEQSLIFFRLDLKRKLTYANLEFCKFVGKKLYEMKNIDIYSIFDRYSEADGDDIFGPNLDELSRQSAIMRYTSSSNESYYISAKAFIVYNIDHQPVEIMVIGTDVTQIYRAKQELKEVQRDIILTMAAICEGKSRETGNHVRRVAEFSALLAELYGCSDEEVELIRITAPMHDIGKLTVPEDILNKPAKLTPEEFEVVKKHSFNGYELLNVSNRHILRSAAKIALTHHEWWNGNGYPNKLQGEEIPLFGRIVALADVFDALSHDRCYKKAWEIKEVLNYIVELKGVQFEGRLVEILVDNLPKFLEIKEHYRDYFYD